MSDGPGSPASTIEKPPNVGRWPWIATVATFFAHGLLFASWTAHIPQVKDHLHLTNAALGIALLGAPVGSVLAMLVSARLLSRLGSRRMVRGGLLGVLRGGDPVGLAGSLSTLFLAMFVWAPSKEPSTCR